MHSIRFIDTPDSIIEHIDKKTGKPTGGTTKVFLNKDATEETRKANMIKFMEEATGLKLEIVD